MGYTKGTLIHLNEVMVLNIRIHNMALYISPFRFTVINSRKTQTKLTKKVKKKKKNKITTNPDAKN